MKIIETDKHRTGELDKIPGKLPDGRYVRMSAGYAAEQKELTRPIAASEAKLRRLETASGDAS